MTDEAIERAALNNARWCDAVCTAHGHPGHFETGLWRNRHAAPRFYPNAVTLSRGDTASQQQRVAELVDAGLASGWGVKDSFCTLDLSPLGFHVLFEARWISRKPAAADDEQRRHRGAGALAARRVTSAEELAAWERVWADGSTGERVFLPALLRDDIAVIAVVRDRTIVAGVIANRTDQVVGVSNFFTRVGEDARAVCLDAVEQAYPGRTLVGYEVGDELSAMRAFGFDDLGPLRVWLRDSPAP